MACLHKWLVCENDAFMHSRADLDLTRISATVAISIEVLCRGKQEKLYHALQTSSNSLGSILQSAALVEETNLRTTPTDKNKRWCQRWISIMRYWILA